ncbi:MAG TPA: hypothetical protein VNA17_02425 [Pyrinomonadaceae bacterium]|nr:hypothetical protein [Pyrinomonadaceae bacterium]
MSIVERLVPSLSFAVAALSGAAAAMWLQMVLRAMRNAENAGYTAFYNAMAEVYAIGGISLMIALALGLVGIATSAARMFTANRTASPTGVLFLLPAGICLVPALLVDYAGWLAVSAVNTPGSPGISGIAVTISVLNWAAVGTVVLAFLILAMFSFIPFRSRKGRKFSPVLCLIFIEVVIAALAVSFLLGLRMCWSLAEAHY